MMITTKNVKTLFTCLFFLLLTLPEGALTAQKNLQLGRILHYKCDHTAMINSSPNLFPHTHAETHNLEVRNGLEGKSRSAYYFNNLYDWAKLPNAPKVGRMGISLWFKLESGHDCTLIGYEKGGFHVGLIQGKVDVRLHLSEKHKLLYQPQINYLDQQWHHLVVNFTGQRLEVWIDGNKVKVNSNNNNSATKMYPGLTSIHYVSDDLYMGALPNQKDFFHGLIDEVSMWNRPLSQTEINWLYEAGDIYATTTLETGMMVHYPFDKLHPTNNSHVLIPQTNMTPHFSSGFQPPGCSLQENDKAVTFINPNHGLDGSDILQFEAFSLGIHIKTQESKPCYIAAWDSLGYSLEMNTDSFPGQVLATLYLDNGTSVTLPSGKTLNDGKWHHLLLSYDQGTATLYVDGKKAEAKTLSGYPQIHYISGGGFHLGRKKEKSLSRFKGTIDNFTVHCRAIRQDEVNLLQSCQIFNNGSFDYMLARKRDQQYYDKLLLTYHSGSPTDTERVEILSGTGSKAQKEKIQGGGISNMITLKEPVTYPGRVKIRKR